MAKRIELPASHWIDNVEPGKLEGLEDSLKEQVLDVLEELPHDLLEVVELRLWGQMSFRKIGKMLGYKSHSSAYNKYQKAMDILREELDFEDFEGNL